MLTLTLAIAPKYARQRLIMDPSLTSFYRQYLQQVNAPVFPTARTLLCPHVQEQIYRYMFELSQTNLPPVMYRKRILRTIIERIESAIEDPDEDEVSDALMNNMAQLCLEATLPQAEAAMQKSIISYFPPFEASSPILISESPQLLAAGSNVGLRTWDACLRLAYYLSTEGQALVKNKVIIELGAGTGMLSILCANYLGAALVLATDGLPEIVTSMEQNIMLNPPAEASLSNAHAAHFEWSDTETLTQSIGRPSSRDCLTYDLVLGADITYNPEYFGPLVTALISLLNRNEDTSIVIAGAIRNLNTYNAFLETCSKNGLEVLEIDYDCPGLHQQKGFFHAIALPIKIMHIRRGNMPKERPRKARLDPILGKFVANSD